MAVKPRAWTLAWGLCAGLGVAACVDPVSAIEQCSDATVEGEIFTYYAAGHELDAYCPAGFDAAEAQARFNAQAWGVAPAQRLDYWLFDSQEHECWSCPEGATGCGGLKGFETTQLPDHHEIAHAARGVTCFPLVEEGWATLYGGPFSNATTDGDLRAAIDAVDGTRIPGEYYPFAARFIAFSLETVGIEGVREICERSHDAATFESALVDVFGASFEAIEAELDAYPQWFLGELRQDQSCEGDDALPGDEPWVFDLGCETDGVLGKHGDAVWAERLVEFDVGEAYQLMFETDQDVELRVEVRSCERDGLAATSYSQAYVHPQLGVPEPLDFFTSFNSGERYVVRVMIEGWTGPTPRVSVSPAP